MIIVSALSLVSILITGAEVVVILTAIVCVITMGVIEWNNDYTNFIEMFISTLPWIIIVAFAYGYFFRHKDFRVKNRNRDDRGFMKLQLLCYLILTIVASAFLLIAGSAGLLNMVVAVISGRTSLSLYDLFVARNSER